jgi:hypothetical protein
VDRKEYNGRKVKGIKPNNQRLDAGKQMPLLIINRLQYCREKKENILRKNVVFLVRTSFFSLYLYR